ncbi:unnamed protein product [Lactuca virosa]|uniref:beta-ketoacyl-[acyl-carrier-protein] synthase I n=1 Tax=Lactuca virosa TaxID=75947 RepID=A0AAU9NSF0_9ASTR|nr:unnamed protein product [Lactuca virosa]
METQKFLKLPHLPAFPFNPVSKNTLPTTVKAPLSSTSTRRTVLLSHHPSITPKREKDAKKRVVITGMGIVSVFGSDADKFYERLLTGESGISLIDRFDASELTTRFGGQIRGFKSNGYIDGKMDQRLDDCQRYCIVAGKKALEDAAISGDKLSNMTCRLIRSVQLLVRHPTFASVLLLIISVKGRRILSKRNDDPQTAGGVEAAVVPIGVAAFASLGALSKRNDDPQTASRPWDKDRDGFVLGEGAGVLVMESLEHAMKRDAPILAEYLGGAVNCDAHHVTSPRSDGFGVSSCIQRCLANASVSVEEVNYINAHATSTILGDIAEANALKNVFKNTTGIKMNATKVNSLWLILLQHQLHTHIIFLFNRNGSFSELFDH